LQTSVHGDKLIIHCLLPLLIVVMPAFGVPASDQRSAELTTEEAVSALR
jgi:hypothetical protein